MKKSKTENIIDHTLHADLLRRILNCGGEYADVFAESRRSTSLVMEDGRVEKIVTGQESGAGLRLLSGGKTAYASSSDLVPAALLAAAGAVSSMAGNGPAQEIPQLKARMPSVAFSIQSLPDDVPLREKIKLVRKAERIARSYDSRIRQVSVIYRDLLQHVQTAASEGFVAEDDRVYTSFIIQVIAAQDTLVQTGYEVIGGLSGLEILDEETVEVLTLKAARRSISMLTAREAPADRMPVVISSQAGGTMIHEAIGHGLEADLAQQGLSVFSGMLGEKVASDLITVIDDATLSGKRGSFRFDDEGTPSQRTVLVDQGILKSYMYDKLTALKEGKQSTGNGRRESYQKRPIPRMTNTFIAPGEHNPEEIVRSVDQGLFVVKMGGGQVNTVTGDFVFHVQEGYLIRNGMRSDLVRGATLSGNGPEILKSIDMVGNDLGFSIGTCGKDAQGVPVTDAMPTVRIPEIVVGGRHE